MSRSARVRRFFGDADHDFALTIGGLEELQEATDAGPMVTLTRLSEARVKEIKLVLRLGLLGGGMDKEAAYRLVEREVQPGYLGQLAVLASDVVSAAIASPEDEPLGERKGSETPDLSSHEASSGSPTTTAPERSSGGRPKRSAKPRSGS